MILELYPFNYPKNKEKEKAKQNWAKPKHVLQGSIWFGPSLFLYDQLGPTNAIETRPMLIPTISYRRETSQARPSPSHQLGLPNRTGRAENLEST